MTKVKFASNQEHEFITNWKILQKAFKAAGVDKVRMKYRQKRLFYIKAPFRLHVFKHDKKI